MIDDILARLHDWRDNRDRAEAKDLKLKLERLDKVVQEIWARRPAYDMEWRQRANEAWYSHLAACGVEVRRGTACRYWKDGKPLWDCDLRALGSCAPLGYSPPQLTEADALDIREWEMTQIQMQGKTREQAEEILTQEEVRLEMIRLRCEKLGPGIRTVDMGSDPRHPVMVSERTYNDIAGIPGRDEIVALGRLGKED